MFVLNVLVGAVLSRTVDTDYSQTFKHWFRGLTRLFILDSRILTERTASTESQKTNSQVTNLIFINSIMKKKSC